MGRRSPLRRRGRKPLDFLMMEKMDFSFRGFLLDDFYTPLLDWSLLSQKLQKQEMESPLGLALPVFHSLRPHPWDQVGDGDRTGVDVRSDAPTLKG